MGGCASTVEQACFGENERAGADRSDARRSMNGRSKIVLSDCRATNSWLAGPKAEIFNREYSAMDRRLWECELKSGCIFKVSASGREQTLNIEGPGSSFAELPVFDGGNYPASAAASEEAEVLFISRKDFQDFCRGHSEVGLKVFAVVGSCYNIDGSTRHGLH